MRNLTNILTVSGLIALGMITGCANTPPINHGEDFTDDTKPTNMGRLMQAQAASGAYQDAMLSDLHFKGEELNSLGQVKLDLIRKGAPAGMPLVVYLNLSHAVTPGYESAVKAYYAATGTPAETVKVVAGVKSDNTTPSAFNMGGIYKADGTSFTGQAAVDTGGGSGGGMMSGK